MKRWLPALCAVLLTAGCAPAVPAPTPPSGTQPRLNRDDAPVDGATPNAAWTRGVTEMQAVFAADADCRRPAYEIAMRQVADGLDAFEQRHRVQLDAVRAAWHQRVADAARIPW